MTHINRIPYTLLTNKVLPRIYNTNPIRFSLSFNRNIHTAVSSSLFGNIRNSSQKYCHIYSNTNSIIKFNSTLYSTTRPTYYSTTITKFQSNPNNTGVPSSSTSSTSTSSTSTSTTNSKPTPGWVNMLNEAITSYPLETMAGFIAMDIATIGSMYTLLDTLHITIPADFALAFGISRLLRRIRMPIDISFAAILSKVFPSLTLVQPSKAFGNPESILIPNNNNNPTSTSSSSPTITPKPNILRRMGYAFIKLIDKYGLAFLISQRMFVGLASVFTIFIALRTGIDIQSILNNYGFEITNLGKIAGTWAAAACLAAFGFPLVLFMAGYLGIKIGKYRKVYLLNKHKK